MRALSKAKFLLSLVVSSGLDNKSLKTENPLPWITSVSIYSLLRRDFSGREFWKSCYTFPMLRDQPRVYFESSLWVRVLNKPLLFACAYCMIPRTLSKLPLIPHSAHTISSPFFLWCGRVPALDTMCMGSGEAAQTADFRAFWFLEACADLRQESNSFCVVMLFHRALWVCC